MERFGEICIKKKFDCGELINVVREMLINVFQEKVFEQEYIEEVGIIVENRDRFPTVFYIGRNLSIFFGYNSEEWISCISIEYRKEWMVDDEIKTFDEESLKELVNLIVDYTGGSFHGCV